MDRHAKRTFTAAWLVASALLLFLLMRSISYRRKRFLPRARLLRCRIAAEKRALCAA